MPHRPATSVPTLLATFLPAVLVATAVLFGGAAAVAAQGAADVDPDPRVAGCVSRGLDYLRRTQAADGSWQADVGFKLMDGYQVTTPAGRQRRGGGGHPGISSLAVIAFLAGGNVPGRGPYGATLRRGVRYILSCVNPESGYIQQNGSRMYSHAFATLCLAEIYGMTHQADLREKLQQAANLIVTSQNAAGSWRYLPMAKKSDMSITVCQVQALRAARNVGVRVPRATIDRAVEYIIESAVTWGDEIGGFKYQPRAQTRTSWALTAAGVTALHGAGVYQDESIRDGLDYLHRFYPRFRRRYHGHYFYYYGHYYAVQAMYVAGGRHWRAYYPMVRGELLAAQQRDGSWLNPVGPGPVFGTAVACIILQIPKRYLPIFQR